MDNEERKSSWSRSSLRKIKLDERLNMNMFNTLTHNSIPLTMRAEDELLDHKPDENVSMRSETSRMSPIESHWEKYVHQMSAFYCSLLSELV